MDYSHNYVLDDVLWERLFELTHGAAALCYQCGVCTAICPWGMVRNETLNVRTLIRKAQLGLPNGDPKLWLCTTCAQCEAYCPRGVDITDVLRGLRTIAWERRTVESGLPSLLWSIYWNGNPWSQPPSQRAAWAKKLDPPIFDPKKHEILLYIGCTTSYDRRAQKIALALVRILEAAGVKYGYLSDEEPCCGEAALSVGHTPYFEEIALHTAQVFQEKGVNRLVAVSPHCYDAFKNHYPPMIGEQAFIPTHYTQYLLDLLKDGRLDFTSSRQPGINALDNDRMRVAFQDPCYLGRHNGEYEAPRRLLTALPGVDLVEMEQHGVDGLCCGGGGGRMWLETAPGERFSDLRIRQAVEAEADILATACPFCIVCLEDSAKVMKVEGLQVLDVAEILALAL
jgi:Fe-S oxidoreductase